MKRVLSGIMAVIMVLGASVVYRAEKTEVQAAVPLDEAAFYYHYTDLIGTNPIGLIPDERTKSVKAKSEIVLSFPSALIESGIYDGTYTLTYAYNNNESVKVDFLMAGTQVIMNYKILDNSGALANQDSGVPKQILSMNNGTVSGMRYYFNGIETPLTDTLPRGFDVANMFPGPPNDGKSVIYTLAQGDSMAFKLLNSVGAEIETVKLLWNSDNRIYYSTNQAKLGPKVYEFKLRGTAAGQAPYTYAPLGGANGKTYYISPGYSIEAADNQLSAKPLAKIGATGTASDHKGTEYILDKDDASVTVEPGDNPEIEISFELPQKWDWKTKSFVTISPLPGGDPKIANELIGARFSVGSLPVTINDLLTPQSDVGAINYEYTYENGRGRLLLHNLLDSTIYPGSSFTLNTLFTTPNYVPKAYEGVKAETTKLGDNDVYTFLSYRMFRADVDSYTLRVINPYKNYPVGANSTNTYGTYSVYVYETLSGGPYYPVATLNVGQGINDKLDVLTIPVPLTIFDLRNPPYHYWIAFTPSGGDGKALNSQIIRFTQKQDFDTLQTPKDFTIMSSSTVRVLNPTGLAADASKTQEFTRIKFTFSTGLADVLDALEAKGVKEVFYVLNQASTPNNPSAEPFMTLRLSLENGVREVTLANNPDGKLNYSIRLVSASFIEQEKPTDKKFYGTIIAEVLVPSAPLNNTGSPLLTPAFRFPSVYYASVLGIYEDGEEKRTSPSNEDMINVPAPSDFSVPVPTGLTVSNIGTDTFDLSFRLNGSDVFKYMDYILNPYKTTLSYEKAYDSVTNPSTKETSVSYNIYVGQDFASMQAIAEASAPPAADQDKIFEVKYGSYNWSSEIPFDEFVATDIPAGYTSAKEFMRDGGIYLITGIPQKSFSPWDLARNTSYLDYRLTLSGLDDNAGYYAALNTVFTPYDTEWKGTAPADIGVPLLVDGDKDAPPKLNTDGTETGQSHPIIGNITTNADILGRLKLSSGITSLVAATTKAGVSEPSADEFEPPAPNTINAQLTTDGEAKVDWNRIQQSTLPKGITQNMLEYEIVRVKSEVLPSDFRLMKNPLTDVLAYIKKDYPQADYAAWRTDKFISGMPTALDEWTNNKDVLDGEVTYLTTNTLNNLTDDSLVPGTLYVYYVRTLLKIDPTSIDDNNILKYSVWVPVSVTTSPIKGPINLKALNTTGYDRMHEALISFDAPVIIDLINSGKYSLIYSIKPDEGDWGGEITMTPKDLIDGNVELEDPKGYYNYRYKITGLESGSSFMFRVRIKDNGTGDKSVWSNVVPYRTEVDPNKPDDKWEKWQLYFRQKLEELLKRPYWPIRDSSETAFEAVYRGSMFNGVLGNAPDGIITAGKDSVRSQVYYIPAKEFATAAASGASFKITSENVTLTVPTGAIDSQNTQAVKDIIKNVNDNKIRDYYVAITLSLNYTNEKVNGNDALTDRISISIKTVGFEELETIWDNDITSDFKVLLNDSSALSKYDTRISNAVKNGYTDEEMVRLIDELVKDVDKDFIDTVRRSFDDTRQYEYEAGAFASPVRLAAVPKQQAGQASIAGYQFIQGQWQSLPATQYGTGKSILPVNSGTYIFSGATVNIPGITEMQNGDAITRLVIKYGLDDFFGKGNSFTTSIPVTNDALIGSIARLAGASNTQDAATFLREKGVAVSARNAYAPATNETTVYMIMSLYEIKTNTKVSTIRITNQNIVKDIPGIGANYVPHYKAAYQIGIMDKNYQPKEQMSVKDFLQILGRLAGKINL